MTNFSNRVAPACLLTFAEFEKLFYELSQPYTPPRPQLIVSPEVMHLIDTDPVVAEAARIALEGG